VASPSQNQVDFFRGTLTALDLSVAHKNELAQIYGFAIAERDSAIAERDSAIR